MALTNHKAIVLAGLALYGSLVLTTAFAGPPKKKTPPKKTGAKVDIAAGKKVYEASGCANCHMIKDQGNKGGPELTNYGESKHDAKWTAVQIKTPSAHKEGSGMPAYGDKIKGKDLDNLVGYLLSLKGDKK